MIIINLLIPLLIPLLISLLISNLMTSFTLILAFIGLFFSLGSADKKLVFVQELFRHGARYPLYTEIGDPSIKYAIEENSVGELTNQGKRMHYLLGQALYKEYWNQLFANTSFLTTYNQSKFYFKSTDVNRTIESVQSQLVGIFENLPPLSLNDRESQFTTPQWPGQRQYRGGQVYTNATKFRALPVHVEKGGSNILNSGDFLRNYSPENCPNQDIWMSINQQSDFSRFVQKHPSFQTAIQALQAELNNTNLHLNFFDIYKYMDNYKCTQYLTRPGLKVFSNPTYSRTYQIIEMLSTIINLFYAPKQLKATATPFFNATIHNIRKLISKKSAVQWVMYSAHDTTLLNVAASLNLTNVECVYQAFLDGERGDLPGCIVNYPIFSSNLIFEVWEENFSAESEGVRASVKHTIKIRYNGIYQLIPFCGLNQKECQLGQFEQWYNNFKDQDHVKTCGVISTEAQFATGVAVIEFGLIIVFALGFLIAYLKKRGSDKDIITKVASEKPKMTETLLSEERQEQ